MNFLVNLWASVFLAASPSITFSTCEFGERYQSEVVECDFEVRNQSAQTVRLSNIVSAGSTDIVSPSDLTIEGGGLKKIAVRIDTTYALGDTVRFVKARLEPENRDVTFVARGFVQSDLDDASRLMQFGLVTAGVDSEPKELELSSREVPDFQILDIVDAPSWVSVSKSRDGRSIVATVKADAPWGLQRGNLRLSLNTPHQKYANIRVSADVRGSVVPDSNPRDLGTLRVGDENEFKIRLTDDSHKKIQIGTLRANGADLALTQTSCMPSAPGCELIVGRFRKDQTPGAISGSIEIELPDYQRSLSVAFGGLMVARETKVVSVPDNAGGAPPVHPHTAPSSPPPFDLKGAMRSAVVRSESPTPAGVGPVLTWQVANELQLYGYLIYRSESEQGPFLRMNPEVIRTQSADGKGWTYHWRDTSAARGTAYWYYVSALYRTGVSKQLSGQQRVVAK